MHSDIGPLVKILGLFVLAGCAADKPVKPAGGADPAGHSTFDWPQWLGPNRDGISSEKGWLSTWPPRRLYCRNNKGDLVCLATRDN